MDADIERSGSLSFTRLPGNTLTLLRQRLILCHNWCPLSGTLELILVIVRLWSSGAETRTTEVLLELEVDPAVPVDILWSDE